MTIITTGVQSATQAIVARQDLREFIKDKYLLNLYILATLRLQQVDQQELQSWFQLSGIHGRPYIPFDNVGSRGNFGGYCTHSSILFPTWHRPYLALYEQVLAKHVTDIANEFDSADKAQYVSAAARFRIPYWDWASDAYLPDIIAKQETVQVTVPKRGTQQIKNPLYSYTFHPVYSDFGDGLPDERTWESWQSTLRWPSRPDAGGRSQPVRMEAQLNNNRLTLRDRTYNLLTQATSYEAFSNDGFLGPESDPAYYDSLESIHGQIHGFVGRNGHMGVVDYAAFDPVFWLHHTNVDRLFAIWQALNPTKYVIPRRNDAGTFTTRAGTVEDANSPLQPFWQSAGKFWTSTGSRDTRTFRYTYPELTKWSELSDRQKRVRLGQELNRLYGKTAPVAAVNPGVFTALAQQVQTQPAKTDEEKQKVLAAPAPAPAQAPAAQAPTQVKPAVPPAPKPAAVPAVATKPAPKKPGEDEIEFAASTHPAWHQTPTKADDKDHYHEWIANIRVEKYAVKSTFFVHVFLGDFNSDPVKWGEDPNLVGSHVVFANNANFTGCERCIHANETHKLVTGTIPLTGALGDKLGKDKLRHLEPELVIPYLKKNLHWRIQKHDDTVVERADVPSLKISVGHALVEIPKSSHDFPKWGQISISLGVTAGRLGGANERD